MYKDTVGLYVDVAKTLNEKIRKYCYKNEITKRAFIEAASAVYLDATNKNAKRARKTK